MSDLALSESGATFSPDRLWRFTLWRRWSEGPILMVTAMNPSTADENVNDPTVTRCVNYAALWGYGGLLMTNLFPWRATDPKNMWRFMPDHPDFPAMMIKNQGVLRWEAKMTVHHGGAVLAAWGSISSSLEKTSWERDALWALEDGTPNIACLKKNKNGSPVHPLYQRRDAVPVVFLGDGGRLVTDHAKADS